MIYVCLTDIEKMDCRDLRQSESVIPENVISYIEDTANFAHKKQRLCAYSSLFFALNEIYGEKCGLAFSKDGKPYLTDSKRKISVSLSHCNCMSAVCLTDEGEVGVDIQEQIDRAREKRLENRFFTDLQAEPDNCLNGVNFLIFEIIDGRYALSRISEENLLFIERKNDFSEKWSLGESILKCDGGGFGVVSDIGKIQKNLSSVTKRILKENKQFSLSITLKRL